MKTTGKLDYIELPAIGATLDRAKAFYSQAFGWAFTDYGPTYAAFNEGLDGGFQAEVSEAPAAPLPVLYSENLEATLDAVKAAGGTILKPIFSFPGGRRFHFRDPAGNEIAVWGE
jgi:uncharacterized protein